MYSLFYFIYFHVLICVIFSCVFAPPVVFLYTIYEVKMLIELKTNATYYIVDKGSSNKKRRPKNIVAPPTIIWVCMRLMPNDNDDNNKNSLPQYIDLHALTCWSIATESCDDSSPSHEDA